MKKYKLIYLLVAFASLLGCSKKLEELYANPNAPVEVPIEQIFPSLIGAMLGSSSASGSSYGMGGDIVYTGRYIQYWNNYAVTTSQNGGTQFDEMGGTIGSSDVVGQIWAMFYYGQGQNLNKVIQWGTEQQKWDFVGAATALRAWGWLELTDEYNIAILREAFNTSLQQFTYQDQEEVYDTVRTTCFRALAFLNRTDGNVNPTEFANSDAYFNNGNLDIWKKFIYGILARSYAYISNKSSYNADSVIKYANLSMQTNADNATLKFIGDATSGHNNYFGKRRGNIGSLLQSSYVADLMSGLNSGAFTGVFDPRAWYILRENADSSFKGVTPGVSPLSSLGSSTFIPQNFWGNSGTSGAAPSTELGRYIYRDSAQFPIMTASEMQFLKAEAAFRKGDKTTALAAYKNAISLDFDMLSTSYPYNVPINKQITPASKASYMANSSVVPTSESNLTLTQIMLQKYIALYGWGVTETWVDMRRFHYTDNDPATGKQVYVGFVPAGGTLYPDNGGAYVYRVRPRYNSEYIYDIPSLRLIGAVSGVSPVPNYHTLKTWFAQ
ncbi:SusD/RagB family nutrient-binding outer membrane lipoprotein [Arachidicoccus soli]|uniref:SusD/RagB family nutrient-binding outer membrane lipoprotein n=1 Tax=Arachidicoccus soli TaxID=2341117 RepID=A0A386HT81_9BACT|nr:SusD/RagB family nutrient-binding outer membrane lipoprotein [Arachidicoccus soli]AYD48671.1 hypothetical protein D6B99_14310 [Arachidicoccus soli]